MLKLDQLKLNINHSEQEMANAIAKKLRVNASDISGYSILKKSIDARKKPEVYFVYSVSVELKNGLEKKVLDKSKKDNNINPYKAKEYVVPKSDKSLNPIVIGAGPAGLFAAYVFALNGMAPIQLLTGQPLQAVALVT